MTDVRLALNYAAASDRGLVRQNNEDAGYAGPHLLALADGMGGHAAGEVASTFLVEALRELDSPLLDDQQHPRHRARLTTLLASAADEGNRRIAAHVDENPQLSGMGCTLTSMLFRGEQAAVCHVGDSRAYLLRDDELTQLTKDDTFVQSLVDEGKLDAADASSHPQRSLILKALTGRPVEPALTALTIRPGDRFLLCSDGLTDPVSIGTMTDILRTLDPVAATGRLVEMALRGGGPDNVTVIVADVVDVNDSNDLESELPREAILVGAAAPETPDSPRQDTPASRAAASAASISITHTPAHPVPTAEEAASDAAPEDGNVSELASAGGVLNKTQLQNVGPTQPDHPDSPGGHGKPRKRGWIAAAIATIVVLGLVGGGLFAYNRLQSTYFVAVDNKEIVVKQGAPGTILGISLNSTYQQVCLNEKAEVKLVDAGSVTADGKGAVDCHLFVTGDLNPSARSKLDSMPEDDYQGVVEQINRLAEETLPVCVTRSAETDVKPGEKKPGEKSTVEKPRSGSRAPERPTQSRAPEDLTTPGVSCREVK